MALRSRPLSPHSSNCRSEPARDSGVSVSLNIDCSYAIASRLTPTGFCGVSGYCGSLFSLQFPH
ncbi:hypothetical protein E4T63_13755 [Pseudomonas fluorescens]|uniref:Uncharacterized protein n=1 Tax=Pseudomonas fluorescens TaxID=294 RepID=A0AAP8YXW4_PSEFL|nr:hypothetical protein E4T63_13755 [Pseudomonas fluorescens]